MSDLSADAHPANEASNVPGARGSASDLLFRVMFEQSADAIFLFDPQLGRFIESNDAAARLTCAPNGEALGRASPADLSPEYQPDGRLSAALAQEMVGRALARGSHRFEWVARRFDGTELLLDIVLTAIPVGGRRLLLIVARDMSERNQAETALQESQQLLSSIADNLAEAVFRTSPTHEIVYVNRAYLRIFGYDSLEAVQAIPRERLYARAEDRARFLDQLGSDGHFCDEVEFMRADGDRFWGLMRSVAIRDPQTGKLLYHVGSITDVTERKQMEAELSASEERWRLLFEQSPLSIQLFDAFGRSRRVNRAWEELFQRTGDDLDGFSILSDQQLMDNGLMPYVLRAFAGEVVTIPPVRYELRRGPGEASRGAKWIGALMFPLLNAQRRVIEVVCVHEDLTGRKRAEDAIRRLNATLEERVAERTAELAASEARLRTIIEHAPEAIVVFDADTGRFVSANENAARLYGLSREALLRVGLADVSPERQPDGRLSADVARWAVERALAGEVHTIEWVHQHASGRLIPCEVRLVRLPAERRNLVRGSVLDNTERHRREGIQQATYQISEAAHAAEDLDNLYSLIHAIIRGLMPAENFYIALLDPATQLISFPYHVDQCTPRPPPMKVTKGLTGEVLRTGKPLLVSRTMETRKRTVGQAVLIDGVTDLPYIESGKPSAIWLGVPLRFAGRPLGVMAVQDYRDEAAYGEQEKQILSFVADQVALAIERKRAEAALREREARLRESEARFSSAFRASPAYMTIARMTDGRFIEVNDSFLEWLGCRREEVLGRSSTELGLWPEAAERATFWAQLEEKRNLRHREQTLRDPRGALHTMLLSAEIVEINGLPHVLTVGLDITDRKQAEAELLRTLAREKELSELKSSVVSMVSHEFRTPLGVIQSSAEILADYFDQLPAEERRDHLRSITKNTRRMAGLMEEVLVLGRLDAGKMGFQPAPLDLQRLCQRLVEEVASATEHTSPIEMRGPGRAVEVKADENLLRHILINLLTNAVKYSEPGTPVTMTLMIEASNAVFEVRDRGIGIPEADQPWLFNAFHRGRNVGRRAGTGLGLVIVKRCVELHGGQIRVESRVGVGTLVTVRLPVVHEQLT